MSDIPAEVHKISRDIAQDISGMADPGCFAATELIARAILSERERCAKISGEWRLSVSSGVYDNFEVDEIGNTIGPNIATAIRGNFESGANAAANSPALESAAATRTATTEIQND